MCLPHFRKAYVHAKVHCIPADGEYHRMAEVGCDSWRLSSPTFLLKQGQLEQVVQYVNLFGMFHLIFSEQVLQFLNLALSFLRIS